MFRCSIVALLLAPCLLIGCGRTPGAPGGNVAVVDLDKIAAELGLSQQWNSALSAKQTNVNQQLNGFQQKLNEQLQKKRSAVVTANGADTPLTDEDKLQLVNYQQELSDKLREAQTKARQHLNDQRSKIIRDFRKQAEQISTQVALQKGYDVVLTKNDTVVLTFSPAADITPDVTRLMQQSLIAQRESSAQSTDATRKQ